MSIFTHPLASFVPALDALAVYIGELAGHPLTLLDTHQWCTYQIDAAGEVYEFDASEAEGILAESLQSIVDAANTDPGSFGTTRHVEVNTSNYCQASGEAFIFSFGAYGAQHVLAFGHCEDALEEAAETVLAKWPGLFTEIKLPDNYPSLDEDAQDKAHNEATADLTYTESGYLPSHEWTMTEVHSLADLIAFVTRK